MDFRQLRNYVAVVEARSFTAASLQLKLSQPALSQSIGRLEDELGCALLLRNKRLPAVGVVPTAAGESLFDDAVEILRRVDAAADRARRAGEHDSPTVLLGFASATPRELVDRATALSGVDESAPDVVPVQLAWGQEIAALFTGRVDLAFLQHPLEANYAGLETRALQLLHRVAVLPSAHPLAERTAVTLTDLAHTPILDPGRFEDAPELRDYWLGIPRPAAAPIGRIVGPPTRTVEEMFAFVRAGRGMAIAAAAVAEQYHRSDLVFIPISDLDPMVVGIAIRIEERRAHVRDTYETLTGDARAPG